MYSNLWVVPEYPEVAFGGVVIVDLVGDLGVGLKRAKTMREAVRHEKLLPSGGGEIRAAPPAVGRRPTSDVDDGVHDRPPHDTNKLGLSPRRDLEMEAAHGSGLRGTGLVVLYERCPNPDFCKSPSVVALDEIAARVLTLRWHDPQHIADFQPVYRQVRQGAPHAGAGVHLPIRLCRWIGRAAPRVKSSGPPSGAISAESARRELLRARRLAAIRLCARPPASRGSAIRGGSRSRRRGRGRSP